VFYNVGFVKVADVTAIFTDFAGLLVICSPRKHVTEVLCPDFHLLCSGTGNRQLASATGNRPSTTAQPTPATVSFGFPFQLWLL
jgi:hypothetical protein